MIEAKTNIFTSIDSPDERMKGIDSSNQAEPVAPYLFNNEQ
jgi:hypothetical protein